MHFAYGNDFQRAFCSKQSSWRIFLMIMGVYSGGFLSISSLVFSLRNESHRRWSCTGVFLWREFDQTFLVDSFLKIRVQFPLQKNQSILTWLFDHKEMLLLCVQDGNPPRSSVFSRRWGPPGDQVRYLSFSFNERCELLIIDEPSTLQPV